MRALTYITVVNVITPFLNGMLIAVQIELNVCSNSAAKVYVIPRVAWLQRKPSLRPTAETTCYKANIVIPCIPG